MDLPGGLMRARCPACAEQGQDKKGEHLRVYPDGRFGCCVFPNDREHRRRIFALAGERGRQGIKVRVATANLLGPVRSGILGRLGRLFPTATYTPATTDATDGVGEVQTQSAESRTPRTAQSKSSGEVSLAVAESRTLRTGLSNSKRDSAEVDCQSLAEPGSPRTPRTPFENSRVCTEGVPSIEGEYACTHKEFREGVRCVREGEGAERPPEAAGKQGRIPYFTPDGTLVIPFDSPERFHWWKGGQRLAVTRKEVRQQNAE